MTREEAIRHLTSLRIHSENRRLDKDIEALDKAVEVLEQSKWIPVSEGLPKVGELCLLTVHEYGWNCNEYTRVIIGEYNDNYKNHILAWMPLPKPYEEVKE